MRYTNTGDVPLGLAVWLVHDEYDYIKAENYISVTQLMKPIRQIILTPRVPRELQVMDVSDLASSSLGSSLHDSIEKAWEKGYQLSLKKLGYPEKVIERVLVNPTQEQLQATKNPIPVYLEQRSFKKITVNGKTFTIGGKFDMVTEGILNDIKSTSAFTWLYSGKDDDYILQGSFYRWLDEGGFTDPECTQPIGVRRITEDYIRINFIFTDWKRNDARQNPNYPQNRLQHKDYPLLSLEETEQWIRSKIAQIIKYREAPERDVPECTDEELWKTETVFKYYANPAKTDGRSTKNFTDLVAAKNYQQEKGGKGIIITVPGEPKRCEYCPAFAICSQRMRYFHD